MRHRAPQERPFSDLLSSRRTSARRSPHLSRDRPQPGRQYPRPFLDPGSELGAGTVGPLLLYFADHKGDYIRLAYADELLGPWKIYGPGSLQLNESHFATQAPEFSWVEMTAARLVAVVRGVELQHDLEKELTAPHIASPDVHVDAVNQRIVMYFHGLSGFAEQSSRVATSTDGIRFDAQPQILGKTYLRAFSHAGATYGLAMPGQFYRSEEGFTNFETGPRLFGPDMRHAALLLRGDTLHVFWSRVGDAPERILLSTIDVSGPWEGWSESAPAEVLRPERRWEGADAPPEPSVRSVAYGRANQLRDPAIFEEDGRVFLLYSTAGESGIGIVELHFDP
jgi:hypothetical protein